MAPDGGDRAITDPIPADPPAGVHRLRSRDATSVVADRLARDGWAVVVVDLADAHDKAAILAVFAGALTLPDWFGHNWDALADSLRDLGWWPAGPRGRVLIVRGAGRPDTGSGRDREMLRSVLDEAAASWRDTRSPLVVLLRR